MYDLTSLLAGPTTYDKRNTPDFLSLNNGLFEEKTLINSNSTSQFEILIEICLYALKSGLDRQERLGCSFIALGLMQFIHGNRTGALS